ncbi:MULTISPECIES: hypothetical protein [Streptomyces]|uniref:Uncharacterized protein n=1 Tax=Streptomyces flavochromogenes TaxID=68199 RepID=A0ABW6Y3N6_9ACTN
MSDRHNIAALPDGGQLPDSSAASAGDLGRVIGVLASLAPELAAPVVVEELRLAQYERAAELARWVAEAADDLARALRGHQGGGQ